DGSYGPPDEDLSCYLANVELPGNEIYYSFDYNNQIHFVFINSDEISDENQMSWLINDLETNTLDFVSLVLHRPVYSVRDSSRVAAAQSIRAVIEPILIEYDVDVVFAGHDHYYYRTLRNGVFHIVTGAGGAPLASNNDLSEWQEGDIFFSKYHYCNISVTQSDENMVIKVEMLIFDEIEGTTTLGDSFEISSMEATMTHTTTKEITTSKRTPSVLPFTIIGIIFISFLRKWGKSKNP
ncbi:MAG: metallophosphoesterase family protein, partial [Promethearchaeota archaeon]